MKLTLLTTKPVQLHQTCTKSLTLLELFEWTLLNQISGCSQDVTVIESKIHWRVNKQRFQTLGLPGKRSNDDYWILLDKTCNLDRTKRILETVQDVFQFWYLDTQQTESGKEIACLMPSLDLDPQTLSQWFGLFLIQSPRLDKNDNVHPYICMIEIPEPRTLEKMYLTTLEGYYTPELVQLALKDTQGLGYLKGNRSLAASRLPTEIDHFFVQHTTSFIQSL